MSIEKKMKIKGEGCSCLRVVKSFTWAEDSNLNVHDTSLAPISPTVLLILKYSPSEAYGYVPLFAQQHRQGFFFFSSLHRPPIPSQRDRFYNKTMACTTLK